MLNSDFITRSNVPKFLKRKTGLTISAKTLANLASVGAGPEYQIWGRTAYYRKSTLLAWAEVRLGVPKSQSWVDPPDIKRSHLL